MRVTQFPLYCGGRLLFGLSVLKGTPANVMPILRTKMIAPKAKFSPENFSNSAYSRICTDNNVQTEILKSAGLSLNDMVMIANLTTAGIIPLHYRELREPDAARDNWGYKMDRVHIEPIPKRVRPYWMQEGNNPSHAPISVIPDNKEDFYYLLHHTLKVSGNYAFVHAVTNINQTEQGKWLEEAGFTVSGEGAKPGGHKCVNWIGNNKKLDPFLDDYKHQHKFHLGLEY